MSQNDLNALQNHNWHDAFIKLKAYAVYILKYRYKNLPLPKGRVLDDLIQEAVTSIWDDESSRNWESEKHPDIDKYLMGVVSSKMYALFVSAESKTTTSYSQNSAEGSLINSLTEDPLSSVHIRMDLTTLIEKIKGELEDDMEAYFVFIERLNGLPNREIALSLEIEVRLVENAQKRINRVIKKHEKDFFS